MYNNPVLRYFLFEIRYSILDMGRLYGGKSLTKNWSFLFGFILIKLRIDETMGFFSSNFEINLIPG